MINPKAIILGFILAKILSVSFGYFTGYWNTGMIILESYLAYFLAAVYVGYYVGEDYFNGAIHGAVLVLFGLLISMIPSFISIPYVGSEALIHINMLYRLILGSILNVLVGCFGGALGVFLIEIKFPRNFFEDRWLIKDSTKFIKSNLKIILINLNKILRLLIAYIKEIKNINKVVKK